MSYGYVDDNCFKDIANSIRYKTGGSANYYPTEMANAINNISGSANLGTKSIIANGVYNALDDSLDGYNSVTVAVPMPTFNTDSLTVSVNGTYNAAARGLDGFSEVNVQVPGGGGSYMIDARDYLLSYANNGQLVGEGKICGLLSPLYYYGQANISKEVYTNVNCVFTNEEELNNFNELLVIGNKVTNCYGLLSGAIAYNQPITIPNDVNSCAQMFYNCKNFNQPITLPDSLKECTYMFYGCESFDQAVVLPNGVTYCSHLFENCTNFNQPITIPNSVTSCEDMFNGCTSFNQPVTIPNITESSIYSKSIEGMFYECYEFNQPLVIPNGIKSCGHILMYCYNFNSPITIGTNVISCNQLLTGCNNFNQDITFPKNVASIFIGLQGTTSFGKNVFINNASITQSNVYRLFQDCNNSLQKNIWCNNLTPFLGNKYANSIAMADITWTEMTNGYYNSVYNIYLYNNYSAETGVIP
jgi:hypothetical protein